MRMLKILLVITMASVLAIGSCNAQYGKKKRKQGKSLTVKRSKRTSKLGQDIRTGRRNRLSSNSFKVTSRSMYLKGENEAWASLHFFGSDFGYGLGYARYISTITALEASINHEINNLKGNKLQRTAFGIGANYSLMSFSNLILVSAFGGLKGYSQRVEDFNISGTAKPLFMGLYMGPGVRVFLPKEFKVDVRYSYERGFGQRIENETDNRPLQLGQWVFMIRKTF